MEKNIQPSDKKPLSKQLYYYAAVIIIIIVAVAIYVFIKADQELENGNIVSTDVNQNTENSRQMGSITDVTASDEIRGVKMGDNISGYAEIQYNGESGSYLVVAQINDVPDPQAGDFYQGWLSNDAGQSISVGQAQKTNESYVIFYNTQADLAGYNKFILTLGPAEHSRQTGDQIAEATVQSVKY